MSLPSVTVVQAKLPQNNACFFFVFLHPGAPKSTFDFAVPLSYSCYATAARKMFLWWLGDKGGSPRKYASDKPLRKTLTFSEPASSEHTDSTLSNVWKSPFGFFWGHVGVPDEELTRVEQEEIQDLEEILSTPSASRKSSVSVGKLAQHNAVEENQQIGMQMRYEAEERRRQRDAFHQYHRDAGRQRAQSTKQQREAALVSHSASLSMHTSCTAPQSPQAHIPDL